MDAITINVPGGIAITLPLESLRPFLTEIVGEALSVANYGDKMSYTEAEAAKLIGVPKNTLRDARLKHRIAARKIGNCNHYTRRSLQRFLEGHPPE